MQDDITSSTSHIDKDINERSYKIDPSEAEMTVEEALDVARSILGQANLSQLQEIVFWQCWEMQSYQEIALDLGYEVGYIRDIGCKLWLSLSKVVGEKVTKNNFRGVLKQQKRLGAIASVMRQAAAEDGLLSATVHQVCYYLHVDRALIYRFLDEEKGVVLAEAMAGDFTPTLGETLAVRMFGAENPQAYQHSSAIALADIYQASLSPY